MAPAPSSFRCPDFQRGLHPREIQELEGIVSAKRAGEWLAARRALKYLACKMLKAQCPDDAYVVKNRFGLPRLRVVRWGETEVFPCSLSHSGGLGAAAVSVGRDGLVGIDLQMVTPKLARLRKAFSGTGDHLGVPLGGLWRWTVLWACKEAAAKALGMGLAVDLTSLSVQGTGGGRFVVRAPAFHAQMKGYFCIIPPLWICSVVWTPRDPYLSVGPPRLFAGREKPGWA